MTREEFEKALEELHSVVNNSSKAFPHSPNKVDLCRVDGNLYDPMANMNQNAPMTLKGIEDLINSDQIKALAGLDIDSLCQQIQDYMDDPDNAQEPNIDINSNDNNEGGGNNVTENWAIVEYGADYIKGKRVDYTLNIKPGQVLDEETMIGTVEQAGRMLPLKSIFATGYIEPIIKTDNNGVEYKDFKRLFPSLADRHFLVHNYTLGQNNPMSHKEQSEITAGITSNTNIYNLIKDHAVYSALPIILDFHEKKSEHPTLYPCTLPHGNSVYSDLVKEYEDYMKNAGSGLKELCSEKAIKSTGARKADMKALGDKVISERENIIDRIIAIYHKAGTKKICYKDIEQNWLSVFGYSVDLNKATGNIFKSLYKNYYVYLLSLVDISQEDNTVNKEYYELLDGIIKNRIAKEYIEKQELVKQFNKLYAYYIEKDTVNGYDKMTGIFGEHPSKAVSEISMKLSELSLFKDSEDKEVIENLQRWCLILANMFLYITKIEKTKPVDKKEQEELDLEKLIKEESDKIKAFWEDKIKQYKSSPLADIIQNVKDKALKHLEFAKWPQPQEITVGGQKYQHYLFKNPFDDKGEYDSGDNIGSGSGNNANRGNSDGDPDAENYNASIDASTPDQTVPDGPDGASAAKAMDDGLAASESESDPKEGEITIMDTEYWIKYFSLATVITLPFLADGFDIPPMMTPVPMPGIYICFSAIPMPQMDMLMVLGLAIRGIYIYPIIQVLNLSSNALTPLTPIVALLKKLQDQFHVAISQIEMCIPNVAGILIDKIQRENQKYAEENMRYMAALNALTNQAIEDKALIKKTFEQVTHPNADTRQNIARTEKLSE